MHKLYLPTCCLLLLLGLLAGCAKQQPLKYSQPDTHQINPVIQQPGPCLELLPSPQKRQKVDNFVVILDTSSSMSEPYKGRSKYQSALQIASCLNQAIPGFNLNGAIRNFGNPVYTALVYGFTGYSKDDFDKALREAGPPDGPSPMSFALDATSKDIKNFPGKTAAIIISDGKGQDIMPVLSAEKMKIDYAGNICFYTVLIGDDPSGKEMLEQIARAGECGFAVSAESLGTTGAMSEFVTSVFLEDVVEQEKNLIVLLPGPDGKVGSIIVTNPYGAQVLDRPGYALELGHAGEIINDPVPMEESEIRKNFGPALDALPPPPARFTIYFAHDSSMPLKNSFETIKEIITYTRTQEAYEISVEGHTDSTGKKDYNLKLSQKRATAVSSLLVSGGIQPDDIFAIYYGEEKPLIKREDNIPEPKNRRVKVTVR